MKTIKDLKIGDLLYCSTLSNSIAVQVTSINYSQVKNETEIKWGDTYYAHAIAAPTDIVLKNGEGKYFYLNPEDAVFHQRTLREEHIQKCKEQLDKAFVNLQDAIKLLSVSLIDGGENGAAE